MIVYFYWYISFIFLSGERYTVGVGKITQEDVVKREIIHQLCITSMAHSELVKALPEDVSEFLKLENSNEKYILGNFLKESKSSL